MQSYTISSPEVNVGNTFCEVLPATKSSKHGAIHFTPAASGPDAGVLTIDTDRCRTVYTVREYPSDWPGRAFVLTKQTDGTDPTAERYDVFCGNRQDHLCDCRGHTRFGHCKHVAGLLALLANNQL